MTELQMGLIGLGAAAVAAVLGYNKWQELRQRKLAEQLLKAGHSDVLLDDVEPGEPRDPGDPLDREPVFAGSAPAAFEPALGADHRGDNRADYGADDSADHNAAPRFAAPAFDERIEPSFGGAAEYVGEPTFAAAPVPERVDEVPPAAAYADASAAVAAVAAPRRAAAPGVAALSPQAAAAASARTLAELREVGEPLHLLSPQVDYIATFDAVEAVPAAHIVDAPRAALARVRKAVHWIGYNEPAHEWEAVIDDGVAEYRHFRAGLQLVDRRGPLADSDLAQFHVAMQDLADQLAAIVDLPPRRTVLEGAAKLDGFCASVDIQIGINVIAQSQAFAGTKLRALAEAAGMVIDSEGRFVRCDDEGNVLYVLINQDAAGFSVEAMKSMATHGVTFLLDVPRVAHGERVFNQMVELAKRFADVLRGTLVDDNRRPLSEPALEPIRRQVAEYQAMMATQGLAAGGALARRLFS